VFFAKGLGAGGEVSANVCFGICVDLLVDIEVLSGTATNFAAGKLAIESWGGRVSEFM
jgi:hypothetical protein